MKAALGSKLLYGQNDSLDTEVNEVLVASEGINELLDHLHKMDARPLVITSRDRTDVLWTLLTAHSNPVGPRIAGVLLTSEGSGPTSVPFHCTPMHLKLSVAQHIIRSTKSQPCEQ